MPADCLPSNRAYHSAPNVKVASSPDVGTQASWSLGRKAGYRRAPPRTGS